MDDYEISNDNIEDYCLLIEESQDYNFSIFQDLRKYIFYIYMACHTRFGLVFEEYHYFNLYV